MRRGKHFTKLAAFSMLFLLNQLEPQKHVKHFQSRTSNKCLSKISDTSAVLSNKIKYYSYKYYPFISFIYVLKQSFSEFIPESIQIYSPFLTSLFFSMIIYLHDSIYMITKFLSWSLLLHAHKMYVNDIWNSFIIKRLFTILL